MLFLVLRSEDTHVNTNMQTQGVAAMYALFFFCVIHLAVNQLITWLIKPHMHTIQVKNLLRSLVIPRIMHDPHDTS